MKKSRFVSIHDLLNGGELFEKIVNNDHLDEKESASIMKQVLSGVKHMHEKNLVHR